MGHAELDMVTAAENAYARLFDAKQSVLENAQAALEAEFVSAFLNEPQRKINTPGFGDKPNQRQTTLADVVFDSFASTNGDAELHELIRIVAGCEQGHNMQLRAAAWIKKQAREHAAFHAEDL